MMRSNHNRAAATFAAVALAFAFVGGAWAQAPVRDYDFDGGRGRQEGPRAQQASGQQAGLLELRAQQLQRQADDIAMRAFQRFAEGVRNNNGRIELPPTAEKIGSLPPTAENIGTELYKVPLLVGDCPYGTTHVGVAFKQSQDGTWTVSVNGGVEFKPFGVGAKVEAGGEHSRSNMTEVAVELKDPICMVLPKKNRLANDANRLWVQLSEDLKGAVKKAKELKEVQQKIEQLKKEQEAKQAARGQQALNSPRLGGEVPPRGPAGPSLQQQLDQLGRQGVPFNPPPRGTVTVTEGPPQILGGAGGGRKHQQYQK